MNAPLAARLMTKYSICPKCGSDKVSGRGGSWEITNHTFTRKCACGWKITLDEREIKKEEQE